MVSGLDMAEERVLTVSGIVWAGPGSAGTGEAGFLAGAALRVAGAAGLGLGLDKAVSAGAAGLGVGAGACPNTIVEIAKISTSRYLIFIIATLLRFLSFPRTRESMFSV
jgi:hypothetical protein